MRLFLVISILFLSGCNFIPKKAEGGGARFEIPWSFPVELGGARPSVSINQPQDPQGPSMQTIGLEYTESITAPEEAVKTTTTTYSDGRVIVIEERLPAGTTTTKATKQNVNQQVGGSWQDTAREIAAKLGSFNKIQAFGVFFLLGAIAMFHPIVRKAVGAGKEIQMATAAVGVALIFGPALFVGNEKTILIVGVLGLLGWYGISRLSYYKGRVDESHGEK